MGRRTDRDYGGGPTPVRSNSAGAIASIQTYRQSSGGADRSECELVVDCHHRLREFICQHRCGDAELG